MTGEQQKPVPDPTGGPAVSGLEKKLETVRRLGGPGLRKMYWTSFYLKTAAFPFHLAALLVLLGWIMPVIIFEWSMGFGLYARNALILFVLACLLGWVKRIRMTSSFRTLLSGAQILFSLAGLCLILVIYRAIDIYNSSDAAPAIMFLPYSPFWILLETNSIMLRHGRSEGSRIFLIVLSAFYLILGVSMAVFGSWIWPVLGAVCAVLMAGVLWIAAFSRIRKDLFGRDALSHKQLRSVLKQMRRNVPESGLAVPENIDEVSGRPFWLCLAWLSFAFQILQTAAVVLPVIRQMF